MKLPDQSRNRVNKSRTSPPEAAVADPLADLEIWDEWSTGVRSFPYPGKYGRLGIQTQLPKMASTASVGVIGEIMAGLFAQQGVAPWVLVRVIQKWPDFIFAERKGRYAFVEAKASAQTLPSNAGLMGRVAPALLDECLVEAVQQLNADPYVRVWGAFTHIWRITPMEFAVTFLELDVPESYRASRPQKILPQAVLVRLSERAISTAAALLGEHEFDVLTSKGRSRTRTSVEGKLVQLALREIEEPGAREESDMPLANSPERSEFEDEIVRQVRNVRVPEKRVGRRFYAAKVQAGEGVLSPIRSVGTAFLFMAALSSEQRLQLSREWQRNWSRAIVPWGELDGNRLWRFGGAVFGLSDAHLQGRSIDKANR